MGGPHGFGLAADSWHSSIFADDGAGVVDDDAAVCTAFLWVVAGGWDGSGGAVDELEGAGTCGGVAEWSEVADGVVVAVDVADGACDVLVTVKAVLGDPGVGGPAWESVDASSFTLGALGMVPAVPVTVVVVVEVVVDDCDVAVDACDVGCDEGMGGGVSVGKTEGLGSRWHWTELWVGLGVIPFLGHSFSNASHRCSHVSF